MYRVIALPLNKEPFNLFLLFKDTKSFSICKVFFRLFSRYLAQTMLKLRLTIKELSYTSKILFLFHSNKHFNTLFRLTLSNLNSSFVHLKG